MNPLPSHSGMRPPRRIRAFTLIEVMVAMAVFSLVSDLASGEAPRFAASPAGGTPGGTPAAEESRTPWKPGRGATRKSGNPRRGHPPA